MEDKYQDWIERYLNHELNSEESASFEKALQEDPALKNQLEYYKLGLKGLKQERFLELRKHFEDLDQKENRRKTLLYALSVMMAGILLFFTIKAYQRTHSNTSPPVVQPIQDSLSIEIIENKVGFDTLEPQTLPSDTPIPKVKSILKKEKTFASERPRQNDIVMHMEPYRGEELNVKIRALGELSPYDLFVSLYWAGKYSEALDAYEKLNEEIKQNSNVLFIKANALLAQKKYTDAIALFSVVKSDPKSRYAEIAVDYYQRCNLLLQSAK